MYIPFSTHTHYSLLQAFSKSDELAERAASFNMKSVAITDYSLSGVVDFFSSMKEKNIKPIIGLKVFVKNIGNISFYVTLIAKNSNGWLELVALSTLSYSLSVDEPYVTYQDIVNLKNIIVIIHSVEGINEAVISDKQAYVSIATQKYLSHFLNSDYESIVESTLEKFKFDFGDRLFVGINRLDENSIPIDKILNSVLTYKSKKLHIKSLGLPNVRYLNKGEHEYQQLLLSNKSKLTIEKLKNGLHSNEYAHLKRYFLEENQLNNYLISPEDFNTFYTEEEVENTNLLDSMCEEFNILNKPSLPKFDCPKGMSEGQYLLELCRDGWRKLSHDIPEDRWDEYADRVRMELKVFEEANLQGYFLIVADYVNWASNQGMLIGPGRGSAGGCLVSYLLGITSIDPIPYDLYFERFYNAGRNAPGKVAYPDIDVDFPISGRERVIEYIRNKYGEDNVCQVATFGRLMGRGALKEIFRAYGAVPPDMSHAISKRLPQESEIADKLEETQEKSIIEWTLKHDPNLISDWCTIDDDGVYQGELSNYFKLASKLEGTIRSYGKHASAVIISDKTIGNYCPMIPDKSTGKPIGGISYTDMEKLGFIKMDVLGLKTLDMLMYVKDVLRYGSSKINLSITDEEDYE